MASYARFHKSDLQMQTPIDGAHWRGKKLPPNPTVEELAAAADAYIARCYDVGLEIIGITDHNLAGRGSFIDHLRAAIDRAAHPHGYRITLFPGFEIAGPIGRGAHMLCLFPPTTPVDTLDHFLTDVGLHPDRRFKGTDPAPISAEPWTFEKLLRKVQDEHGGLAILAHPTAASGAMDPKTVSDFWRDEVIRNEALLAMELPREPSSYITNNIDSLVASVILNRDESMKRRHPIAVLGSSDCKALLPFQKGNPNYIGGRYTWLKMSGPSIEGLRQAFLDHESRIAFGDDRPEDGYTHPRVRSLSISGAAFLSDQSLELPASMTTLIGGAGSGKSTILEYLRIVLAQADTIRGDEVKRSFDLLTNTITPDTRIEAVIERDGATWTLTSVGGQRPTVSAGDPIPDIAQFFAARIFSQKEIYAVARDDDARARLLDSFIRDQLDALRREAEDIRRDLRQLDHRLEGEVGLRQRLTELETERLSLQTKIQSLQQFEEPVRAWRAHLAEQQFVDRLSAEVRRVAEAVLEPVEDLALTTTSLPGAASTGSHVDLLHALGTDAHRAVELLQRAVSDAVDAFVTSMNARLAADDVTAWRVDVTQAREHYEDLRAQLAAHDADPEQLLTYERALQAVRAELAVTRDDLAALDEIRSRRSAAMERLRDVWARETRCRQDKARALEAAVMNDAPTGPGAPFITVEVIPCGDRRSVHDVLATHNKDRRRISDDDWHELAGQAIEQTPEAESALITIARWVEQIEAGHTPDGLDWRPDRQAILPEWLDAAVRRQLEETRVPDAVRITLYRPDGTAAGEMAELSIGQKSTAILALVLADDDAPLIIDQPEDDLDNEFTYRELVPLLRRVKTSRQVIVATHDPNLPVNGDAELIYALEARESRGRVKQVRGQDAVGALDRTPVREAVEDIMEGSEQAFRRRHAKYGF